jgi:TM2 domain-containing membrane protein YozV
MADARVQLARPPFHRTRRRAGIGRRAADARTHALASATIRPISWSFRRFRGHADMGNGEGSTGNVIAAVCSFFVPGLGQLVQGRVLAALTWFVLACVAFAVTWLLTLSLLPFGWFVVAVFSCINAAVYRPLREIRYVAPR